MKKFQNRKSRRKEFHQLRQESKKRKGQYVQKIIQAGPKLITRKYITGRIGSKDAKRKRIKPTTETVMKWQDKRACDKVEELLLANFKPGDLWCTFTLPPASTPTADDLKVIQKEFFKELRKYCKKNDIEWKAIGQWGIGKRGNAHLHLVLPKMDSGVVEAFWQDIVGTEQCPYPRVNTRHLSRDYNWRNLADYIVKNGKESFREAKMTKSRYIRTRNLKQPKVEIRIIAAESWTDKPKPKKGYVVDYEHIRNDFTITGFPYQEYTQIRADLVAYEREVEKHEERHGAQKGKNVERKGSRHQSKNRQVHGRR